MKFVIKRRYSVNRNAVEKKGSRYVIPAQYIIRNQFRAAKFLALYFNARDREKTSQVPVGVAYRGTRTKTIYLYVKLGTNNTVKLADQAVVAAGGEEIIAWK
ncbi:hypothetical protein EVAR_85775_1 [Eumeta japonica]|uniref:Uncharacterized protein n=1 Tax=Eumeta variegata TaxID=151549 RepID=A0A4C2A1K1_EUMVA|nr:hypothetical protein EVAR_85775_1 [Eumeta japonica]